MVRYNQGDTSSKGCNFLSSQNILLTKLSQVVSSQEFHHPEQSHLLR